MIAIRFLLFWILFNTCYASGNNLVGKAVSAPCAACHGQNGQSLNPAWPHLAGQQTDYLKKQLMDLKAGKTRHADAAMLPFILHLTNEDITNLAHFYANQPRPAGSHHLRRKNQQGEALYRFGNPHKNILACIACHGEDAKGNGLPGFPALRGQQIDYVTHQLEAFKTGERDNDPSHTMQRITENMSPDDIHALAHYLASLPR
ncbi:MAG: c-type cytochrome [Gammaproteobacteria bacterium]|nr:c-type cytochrome [Gammaproteobacteria bacterium]